MLLDDTKSIILSPDQATRLMAICALLKQGDICIRSDDEDDATNTHDALCDIGEEMAIQLHGYDPEGIA